MCKAQHIFCSFLGHCGEVVSEEEQGNSGACSRSPLQWRHPLHNTCLLILFKHLYIHQILCFKQTGASSILSHVLYVATDLETDVIMWHCSSQCSELVLSKLLLPFSPECSWNLEIMLQYSPVSVPLILQWGMPVLHAAQLGTGIFKDTETEKKIWINRSSWVFPAITVS